mmetsp:Transcript_20272/g.58790  ORF Transcript_20272/g.58790 Transcript_20272/m.58790 type:complete len:917 (+) Transcript_20272:33-2783(+)
MANASGDGQADPSEDGTSDQPHSAECGPSERSPVGEVDGLERMRTELSELIKGESQLLMRLLQVQHLSVRGDLDRLHQAMASCATVSAFIAPVAGNVADSASGRKTLATGDTPTTTATAASAVGANGGTSVARADSSQTSTSSDRDRNNDDFCEERVTADLQTDVHMGYRSGDSDRRSERDRTLKSERTTPRSDGASSSEGRNRSESKKRQRSTSSRGRGRPPPGPSAQDIVDMPRPKGLLPLLPLAKHHPAPKGATQRNASPQRAYPPDPRVSESQRGISTTNESGFDLPHFDFRTGSDASVPDERRTANSNFSVSAATVRNIRHLDDLVTDNIFEMHGLVPCPRTSNGSRTSFGDNRLRADSTGNSLGNSAGNALNSMRTLFWGRLQSASTSKLEKWSASENADAVGSSNGGAVGSSTSGALEGHDGGSDARVDARSSDAATIGRSSDRRTPTSDRRTPPVKFPSDAAPAALYPPNTVEEAMYGNSAGLDSEDDYESDTGSAVDFNDDQQAASSGSSRYLPAMHPVYTNMDDLRRAQEASLIAAHINFQEARDAQIVEEDRKRPLPMLALSLSGIIPRNAGWLWWLYAKLALLAQAALIMFMVMITVRVNEGDELYFCLTTACIGFGGFGGMVFLKLRHINNLLGPYKRPLELYAANFAFLSGWRIISVKHLSLVMGLWCLSTLSHMIMNLHLECPQAGASSLRSCGINCAVVGIVCMVFYCKLHICGGMELAIDYYCMRVFDNRVLVKGIVEWNVLQALLRRAAHTVEASFFSVSTGILGVVILTFLKILEMFGGGASGGFNGLTTNEALCLTFWPGWLVPPGALVFYFVFSAAAITEKCNRVPALVNSCMLTGEEIDHQKQYVVQYIMHSAAGWYVQGVRLNATWALKMMYFFGVMLFSLLTQSVLKSPFPS